MSRLVGENIESLKPYEPGKPIEELERELGITGSIKLASNENPLGPSPAAVEAIREIAAQAHVYPDAGTYRLRERLGSFLDVSMDEIVVGNGSNEVLTLVVRTFCQPGDTAVVSDGSFIAYRLICKAQDVPMKVAPMTEGYGHDLEAMAAAIDETTKVVFIANPNNPTGTYLDREALGRFLKEVPPSVVVVVDEAYVEYAQADDYASAVELRELRENLIVCRTFSKCYGLAGLRVGFGVAPARLVNYMNRVREPFNSNLLAQAAALAALDDADFVRRSVAMNEAGRARMEAGLKEMVQFGVGWVPSQTNFLLVETPIEGTQVYESMLREGVIVRPMAGYGLPKHVRITIGTEEQVDRCLAALRNAVQGER